MKKLILTLAIISSNGLFSMDPKTILNNRLASVTNDISSEYLGNPPNILVLQAKALSLTTLKTQIESHITKDEAQTLLNKWGKALNTLGKALAKVSINNPANVMAFLGTNAQSLRIQVEQFGRWNKLQKTNFLSSYYLLNSLTKATDEELRATQANHHTLNYIRQRLDQTNEKIIQTLAALNETISEIDTLITAFCTTPINNQNELQRLEVRKEALCRTITSYTRNSDATAIIDELIIKMIKLHAECANYDSLVSEEQRRIRITLDLYNECRRVVAQAGVLPNNIPLLQKFDAASSTIQAIITND